MRIDLDVLSKDGSNLCIPIKLEPDLKVMESDVNCQECQFNFNLPVPITKMNKWIHNYIKDKISNEITVMIFEDLDNDDCFKQSIKFTMSSPTTLKNINHSKCTLLELSFYIYYDLIRRDEPMIMFQPLNVNETYVNGLSIISALVLTNNYNEGFSKKNVDEMWKTICEIVCNSVIAGNSSK